MKAISIMERQSETTVLTRREAIISGLAMNFTVGCSSQGAISQRKAAYEFFDSDKDSLSRAVATTGIEFKTTNNEYILADLLAEPLISSAGRNAQAALQTYLSQGSVQLSEIKKDRWGRSVCRLTRRETDRSIEQDLVEAGLVRVFPKSEHYAFIQKLMESEEKARKQKRGIWSNPRFQVFSTDGRVPINSYQLISGTVKNVSLRKSRLFINFGSDYRTDVTATVLARQFREWSKSKDQAINKVWKLFSGGEKALIGEKVLVRGYVSRINGPSVELNHPMQIELLSAVDVHPQQAQ